LRASWCSPRGFLVAEDRIKPTRAASPACAGTTRVVARTLPGRGRGIWRGRGRGRAERSLSTSSSRPPPASGSSYSLRAFGARCSSLSGSLQRRSRSSLVGQHVPQVDAAVRAHHVVEDLPSPACGRRSAARPRTGHAPAPRPPGRARRPRGAPTCDRRSRRGSSAWPLPHPPLRAPRAGPLRPGVYVDHCATPSVPAQIANGMYGMVVVEAAGGLPPVDRKSRDGGRAVHHALRRGQ